MLFLFVDKTFLDNWILICLFLVDVAVVNCYISGDMDRPKKDSLPSRVHG